MTDSIKLKCTNGYSLILLFTNFVYALFSLTNAFATFVRSIFEDTKSNTRNNKMF